MWSSGWLEWHWSDATPLLHQSGRLRLCPAVHRASHESDSFCTSPIFTLQEAKRGFSSAAVFIARNRFAVLDKSSNQIVIKDLGNEVRLCCVGCFEGLTEACMGFQWRQIVIKDLGNKVGMGAFAWAARRRGAVSPPGNKIHTCCC